MTEVHSDPSMVMSVVFISECACECVCEWVVTGTGTGSAAGSGSGSALDCESE